MKIRKDNQKTFDSLCIYAKSFLYIYDLLIFSILPFWIVQLWNFLRYNQKIRPGRHLCRKMEEWQMKHIRKNFPTFTETIDCNEKFLATLGSQKLLKVTDIEELKAEKNKVSKAMSLYTMLRQIQNSYQTLIVSLKLTNQIFVADILEKGYIESGLTVPSVSLVVMPPSLQNHHEPIQMGRPSSDDASNPGPPGVDQIDFVNNILPLNIKLTRPVAPMKFGDDAYRLSADSKGYALVLNITEFENPAYNRKGATNDTQYMKQLWEKLGYTVTTKQGSFTHEEVVNIFEEFKNQFSLNPGEASSCVIFIGSHGEFGTFKTSATRDSPMNLYKDVIYRFDSNNCPELIGKPKIFLIQACQRFQTDDVPNRTQVDSILQTPIYDTIVGFSTIPGYLSNRDMYLGTWYAYCLSKVIMENAHHMDFVKMLKKTQETMRNITADTMDGQLSTYMDFGIKTLYFNIEP